MQQISEKQDQNKIIPKLSLYRLLSGGSAGNRAVLPVGVELRRRCTPDPEVRPAEEGDLGDLEGREVV